MLLTLDTTDPAKPELLGQLDLGSPIAQIVKRDRYLLVLCSNLVIVDVSQPAAPRRVADGGTAERVFNMRLQGNYAYLLDVWRGLTILDISQPQKASQPAQVRILALWPTVRVACGCTGRSE